jgi:tetratricopeptide (TPR) repeat protein
LIPGFALLVRLVLSAPPASAQTDPYEASIDVALAEYDRGNFVEALAAFERAYELRPTARVLRGIGKVFFELRRYVDSVEAFDAALRSSREPLTDEMRTEVEALRERARGFVGRLHVRTSPPTARITVDGRERSAAPLSIEVGEHTVEVAAAGYEPARRVAEVRPQATTTLVIALDPSVSVVRVDDDDPLVVFVGALGVALAGATVSSAIWLADRLEATARCERAQRADVTCVNAGTLALERDAAVATLIVAGVGTVAAAVFEILLLVDSTETVVGSCSPSNRGLACAASWRF